MTKVEVYRPKNHVRFVTASSLFDGHDASVNIMRRILQSSGVEVIHLGHNRSVEEVVNLCDTGRCTRDSCFFLSRRTYGIL